ncbi:DUF6711 family protein [Paenibacillus sp. GCM10023248]|uniref:DUF6711 family protein n=1 Tax=unclassified Paenibacillus TaxID=185978 RepID=UPI0023788FB7|nr:DUF6711 family protein [Paenibacillus sp. MAHUQ-63]MDD9266048.1 hypothetical protein [Paenibacillus sp. MAHUQ-63]
MALLTIDGVEMPTPSDLTVSHQDLTKDPMRNTNGLLITEFIARKVKLELSWKFLDAEQMSQILNAIDPFYFEVTYIDPKTNSPATKTFYKGDRKMPMLDFIDGTPRYKDVAFNVVER